MSSINLLSRKLSSIEIQQQNIKLYSTQHRQEENKACSQKDMYRKEKDVNIRKPFEELVDVGVPNSWGHFKDGISKACDEVCGNKRGKNNGDTCWWNKEVKEAVSNNMHTRRCVRTVMRRIKQRKKLKKQ